MRHALFTLLLIFSFPVFSTEKNAQLHIDSIQSDGDRVKIAIHSNSKYRVGGERYCLTIGETTLVRSQHSYENNANVLTFNLSTEEFNNITNNTEVILSYGRLHASAPQWTVGTLDKNLLDK